MIGAKASMLVFLGPATFVKDLPYLAWIIHERDRAPGPPASCRPVPAGWKPAVPEQPLLMMAHE
jgi:hypothetical protein